MSTVLLELSGYLTLNCIDQTLYYRKKLVGFKHSALFVFKPSQPKPSILFKKKKKKKKKKKNQIKKKSNHPNMS